MLQRPWPFQRINICVHGVFICVFVIKSYCSNTFWHYPYHWQRTHTCVLNIDINTVLYKARIHLAEIWYLWYSKRNSIIFAGGVGRGEEGAEVGYFVIDRLPKLAASLTGRLQFLLYWKKKEKASNFCCSLLFLDKGEGAVLARHRSCFLSVFYIPSSHILCPCAPSRPIPLYPLFLSVPLWPLSCFLLHCPRPFPVKLK